MLIDTLLPLCSLFFHLTGEAEHGERREWIKPIMFSGGIGTLDADMVNKHPPQQGILSDPHILFCIIVLCGFMFYI